MALRETACVMKRETCDQCAIRRDCAYGYLFETPITDADAVMRLYTHAPHPFVIEGREVATPLVQPGDTGKIGMVLIGEGYRFLPVIFLALQRLGVKGLGRDAVPFEIIQIQDEQGRDLYNRHSETGRLEAMEPKYLPMEPGSSRIGRFTVQLATPLRLQTDGRVTRRPTFVDLVAALNRRVFLFRYFHEKNRDDAFAFCYIAVAESARVLEATLYWKDRSRVSTRQNREVPLGGVAGFMRCIGDIGFLEPLLRAGEYVHVGKNATFGLGEIRLHVED